MNTVALEKFAVSAGGSVDPSKYPAEEFDLYSIPAYDKYEPEVAQGSEIGSTKKTVQPGDVLLSRIVPHIRRVWVVGPSHGRRQIGSGEWIIFRGDSFDSNYLRHMLMADPFHKQFMQTVAGVGGSLLRARPSEVEKIKIPLPSLPEQKRIAAILDKADAIRRKRQQAVKLTEELLRSVFLDMFGDPVTNPKGWEIVQLVEVCNSADDIKCGPFGTQLGKDEFTNEGVPLWGIRNVNKLFELPTYEFLEPRTAQRLIQYSIEPGDIVMTRKGTIGNCAVYPDNFPLGIMHSDLLRLRVNNKRCESAFLAHQLHYSQAVRQQLELISGGAVMPGINVTKLKHLEVLVPPVGIQREFTHRAGVIKKLKKTYKDSLSESDTLFTSLLQRAFRGEL